MDLQAIKAKYEKEQTILETQIEVVQEKIRTYRKEAGVPDEATIEEIKPESEKVKRELAEKESELQDLISQLQLMDDE